MAEKEWKGETNIPIIADNDKALEKDCMADEQVMDNIINFIG